MKGSVLAGALLLTMPVLAQPTAAQPTGAIESDAALERELRMQRMEQLLEEAVARGVQLVEQQLPTVAPQLLFFAGPVQARGFVIDGHGMFFDVEYPVVRRSLLWSMSALGGMDVGMAAALRDMRARMLSLPEGPGRAGLQAIAELEAQLPRAKPSPASGSPSGAQLASDVDPREIYLSALTDQLANAVVAFGSSLGVEGDEWLVVAARDGRGRADPRLVGPRQTLQLRIKGHDLDALRQGRLTVEETRQRVEIP